MPIEFKMAKDKTDAIRIVKKELKKYGFKGKKFKAELDGEYPKGYKGRRMFKVSYTF